MSKEHFTIVTRKGQVTIPAAIRRALGIEQGDKVMFSLEQEAVRLRRTGSVVERTAGIVTSRKRRAPTARALREAAEVAFAEETTERG